MSPAEVAKEEASLTETEVEALVANHLAEQRAEMEKTIEEIKTIMNASHYRTTSNVKESAPFKFDCGTGKRCIHNRLNLVDKLFHLGLLLGQVVGDEGHHLGLGKTSLFLGNFGRRASRAPSEITGSSQMNGS